MDFHQKLYRLRKEKGLTQEALAEKLNTTRQAVSKWENDQGYPETQKLNLLADILGVSIDYLLNEDHAPIEEGDKVFYVSQEMAQSFIFHESTFSRNIALGVFFLISACIPFILLEDESILKMFLSGLLVIIGLGIALATCLNDHDYQYKPLKMNSLLFDHSFIKELRGRYSGLKRKYITIIIACLAIFVLGAVSVFIREELSTSFGQAIISILILLFAFAVGTLFHCLTMIDAYELLIYNDEYMNKLTTRFLNKLRFLGNNIIDGKSKSPKK